jgi:hypothetical protein
MTVELTNQTVDGNDKHNDAIHVIDKHHHHEQ